MAGFDPTLGGSAATSFIDIAEADALLTNTHYSKVWQSNTEAQKSEYLVSATVWLETLDYQGTRCSPSTDNPALPQSLKWPRSGAVCDGVEATCAFIPKEVRMATAVLAAQLSANPEAITGPIGGSGSNTPSGTFVKQQQLGELSITYEQFRGDATSDCDDCDQPQLLRAFKWLEDLLGCWLNMGPSSGAGFVLTRECCPQTPLTKQGPGFSNLMPAPPYNTM